MARKPPKLEHVKHVLRRGKWYSYFDTGTQDMRGRTVRRRLPDYAGVGFFDAYAACMAGRTKRQAKTYTVADLAREYLASTEYAGKADATRESYAVQARKVVQVWGAFPVNELQASHVRKALEGEAWGAGTRNLVLSVLGLIYKWGRGSDRATVDPVRDVDRHKTGEHDPWPEDVLEAALASDDAAIRLAVHLLYFTGQRIGDVCRMRWGDLRDGRVSIRQGKTGKVAEFPQALELKAELDRTAKTGILILEGIEPGALRRKLKAFTKSLGVETVPHGLRKNAVISLLHVGCTVAEVAAITRQTFQVVEHYAAKVNQSRLGDAAILKLDSGRNTPRTGKQFGKQG